MQSISFFSLFQKGEKSVRITRAGVYLKFVLVQVIHATIKDSEHPYYIPSNLYKIDMPIDLKEKTRGTCH